MRERETDIDEYKKREINIGGERKRERQTNGKRDRDRQIETAMPMQEIKRDQKKGNEYNTLVQEKEMQRKKREREIKDFFFPFFGVFCFRYFLSFFLFYFFLSLQLSLLTFSRSQLNQNERLQQNKRTKQI